MKIARWYWALLALWLAAYVAVSLMPGALNLRTPVFLMATFLAVNPLVGLPALVALLSPLIALPFALKRSRFSQGA